MANDGAQNLGSTDNTGGGGGDGNWYDSFTDEALKGNEVLKAYDGPESLARGYIDQGAKITDLEAQLADAAPKIPDTYELPKLDGFSDDEIKTAHESFAADAKVAGLTQEQAAKVFEAYAKRELEGREALTRDLEKAEADSKTFMLKQWGDKHDETLAAVKDAAKTIGGDDFMKFAETVGIFRAPQFLGFMKAIVEKISPDNIIQNGSNGSEGGKASMFPKSLSNK